MTENEIGYKIIGACFKVYKQLGPGLLENIYERALAIELQKMNLKVEQQVPIKVIYDDIEIGIGYKMDLFVEDRIIIEIKSVDKLIDVHHKQLLTYLKLSKMKLGYLVNFNTSDINKSIVRYVNKL